MGSALWNQHDLELIAGPNRLRKRATTQAPLARDGSSRPRSSAASGGPATSSRLNAGRTTQQCAEASCIESTSDEVSAPVSFLSWAGERQDRTVDTSSGVGLTVDSAPTDDDRRLPDNRPLRDLLVALRKLGVIQ